MDTYLSVGICCELCNYLVIGDRDVLGGNLMWGFDFKMKFLHSYKQLSVLWFSCERADCLLPPNCKLLPSKQAFYSSKSGAFVEEEQGFGGNGPISLYLAWWRKLFFSLSPVIFWPRRSCPFGFERERESGEKERKKATTHFLFLHKKIQDEESTCKYYSFFFVCLPSEI